MWDRLSADVANVPAPAGHGHTAGNRADYGKFGYKHDLLVEMRGLSPVVKITGLINNQLSIMSEKRISAKCFLRLPACFSVEAWRETIRYS